MAILFYEGLPGAGKSYEAMATQIVPMLQKGREVVAYIEGLDFERIAEVAQLDIGTVRELLFVVTRDDMKPREVDVQKNGKRATVQVDGAWIEKVRDNAFHVFDEAQNWWPNRMRASDVLTQLVTEHRHRGMDFLLMGQSLMDVLALWRRRVDQKFTFLKLTALGQAKRYSVTVYKGLGNDDFVKVTTKLAKYDPAYFGTYASHETADINTDTYTDGRANVLSTPLFRWIIPVALVLACWGAWTAYRYFSPAASKPKPGSASLAKAKPVEPVKLSPAPKLLAPDAPAPMLAASAEDRLFADLSAKARVRLAGLIEAKDRRFGTVEWIEGGSQVVERMTFAQLEALGVRIEVRNATVKLSRGEWGQIATMWPNEPVSVPSLPVVHGGQTQAPGAGLTFIDGAKAAPAPQAAPVAPDHQPQRVGVARR